MSGDFSRKTFNKRKDYSGVLMQQGRVQLDANWNEQLDIHGHRTETETVDVVGPCGVPLKNDGFKIEVLPDNMDLRIGAGRIYVGGMLCELDPSRVPAVLDLAQLGQNKVVVPTVTIDGRDLEPGQWIRIWNAASAGSEKGVQVLSVDKKAGLTTLGNLSTVPGAGTAVIRPVATFLHQPYYPDPQVEQPPTSPLESPPAAPPLDLRPGIYLAYLDVWKREISHLDDPEIREIALGQADTAVRQQTVWQVRLARLREPFGTPSACKTLFEELMTRIPRTSGLLSAKTKEPEETQNPCLPVVGAGYSRLENQLYRVEIHTEGARDKATFTWSRENASVETLISEISSTDPQTLVVEDVGKDEVHGFKAGQWVEIVDEKSALQGPPRELIEIDDVNPETRTIRLLKAPEGLGDGQRLKLRRWDQAGTDAASTGVAMTSDWIELEAGIVVHFSDGYYRRGDYWLIPARTITGDIEWPTYDDSHAEPIPQPPVGIEHHYCCLAKLDVTAGVSDTINIAVDDCRQGFPSLTEMTRLYYVGGDGQNAIQDITQLKADPIPLSTPLQVGVAMGKWPVKGATIRFTSETTGALIADVETDDHGIAKLDWSIDSTTDVHQARATLLDAEGLATNMYVVFTAHLLQLTSLQYLGGDGQQVMADGSGVAHRILLPATLRVGVFKGQLPVTGAEVRFAVVDLPPNYLGRLNGNQTAHTAHSTNKGIAECTWEVDSGLTVQHVTATLFDGDGDPVQGPITFTAVVWPQTREGCCATLVYPNGKGTPTLAEALAPANTTDKTEIILCLLPGTHELKHNQQIVAEHLVKIVGCAARIELTKGTRCYLKAQRILLVDLDWIAADRDKVSDIILSGDEVTVERCSFERNTHVTGETEPRPLVLVEPRQAFFDYIVPPMVYKQMLAAEDAAVRSLAKALESFRDRLLRGLRAYYKTSVPDSEVAALYGFVEAVRQNNQARDVLLASMPDPESESLQIRTVADQRSLVKALVVAMKASSPDALRNAIANMLRRFGEPGGAETELRWNDNHMAVMRQTQHNLDETVDFFAPAGTVTTPYEDALGKIRILASTSAFDDPVKYTIALDEAVVAMADLSPQERKVWAKKWKPRRRDARLSATAAPVSMRAAVGRRGNEWLYSPAPGRADVNDAKVYLSTELEQPVVDFRALRENLHVTLLALNESQYARALALAPGVGGWINDNTVWGQLLLQFAEGQAFDAPSSEAFWAVFEILKKPTDETSKTYRYLSPQLELDLTGNRLARVISNDSGLNKAVTGAGGTNEFLNGLGDTWRDTFKIMGYESMNVAENSFLENDNSVIASSLFVNGNCFFDTGKDTPAAHILGYECAIVGNSRKGSTVKAYSWPGCSTATANLITVS